MQISLEGQVVVVTGGAKRIGRAIALECAASGASVAITYHSSPTEAETTLREMRAGSTPGLQKFIAIECDLAGSQNVLHLRNQVLQALGTPTVLVNNAAIFHRAPFEETEYSRWEEDFDDHIAANLKAPYLLSKVFGDLFLENENGAIINIADIYGARPLKNYAAYCVSKAGVLMLTQTLAKALAPNVRVNAICPGTILLPSQEQGEDENMEELLPKIPMKRLGTPAEVAAAVVFLIGGPQFITGAILPVDGAQSLR